jgi:chemotaxis protein CheX
MDATYIVPFVKAVENVFATMVQIQVKVGKPTLTQTNKPQYDVSGIIGMSGDVTGAVVLSLPVETSERLVALFTGMDLSHEHEDFADAIGELVNMVAGNAKADFVDRKVNISCPSVVIGSGHRVFQQKQQPIIEIPCDCECGQFVVEVAMRDGTGTEATATAATVEAQ